MAETKQVTMSGTGGQGIILAGLILGHAGINDGKYVSGSSAYGAQARGGYSRTGIIISDEPIHFPHVIMADILVALSQESYDECIDNVVGENSVVIYDKGLVSVKEIIGLRQIGIPATEMAIQELNSKQTANMVVIGAVVGITNIVTERFRDLNLKGIRLGYKLSNTLK